MKDRKQENKENKNGNVFQNLMKTEAGLFGN